MPDPRSTRWLRFPVPRPAASVRLVCLPHAGGGAATFRDWATELPPNIEVVAVRLPGRESRAHESALTDWPTLLTELRDEIKRGIGSPFAFFGHSFGAMLAHELCMSWQEGPGPEHLVLAGCAAPDTPCTAPDIADASRCDLVLELRRRGALPDHVLTSPALLELLLPMVRADIALAERWARLPGPPTVESSTLDMTVLSGTHDAIAPPAACQGWERFTRGRFAYHVVSGGHFFVHESRSAVLPLVAQALSGREVASAE
jgi:medium-chain acyl-[acyl-carrier-protein] hydrolase